METAIVPNVSSENMKIAIIKSQILQIKTIRQC